MNKQMTAEDERLARLALSLLELTALSADETERHVIAMCERALTPLGTVAALCVPPRFTFLARNTLDHLRARDVRVVAVANFPYGGSAIEPVVSQVRASFLAGADEVDVVYPFRALLSGDSRTGFELVAACKACCPDHKQLTVTLETGDLADPQIIRQACQGAIMAGADFIKTSTGKAAINATPQAARIMIEAIAEVGGMSGFKAAGGIRTFSEARVYLNMALSRFGTAWVNPEHMRLSASSLLDDVLIALGVLTPTGY